MWRLLQDQTREAQGGIAGHLFAWIAAENHGVMLEMQEVGSARGNPYPGMARYDMFLITSLAKEGLR